MKKVFVFFFVFLSFFMILNADTLKVKNKVYIIKDGDCLWNIANKFYKNPYLWPNIWERNTYIKNPDLIFPEDELVIPNINETTNVVEKQMVKTDLNNTKKQTSSEIKPESALTEETSVSEKSETPKQTVQTKPGSVLTEETSVSEKSEAPQQTVQDINIPINYDEFVLRAGGVVSPDEVDESGYISGFENSYNELHAENEIAYVTLYSTEVAAGDNFIIYTLNGKVKDPETKRVLGKKLKIKGILTVVEMGENNIKANIKKAYDNIGKGDLLMPYNEKQWLYSPEAGAPTTKDGVIVGYNSDGTLIGKVQDILYIDLGKEDGVKQGQKFYIIRNPKKYKDPVSGRAYTDTEKIGSIKVIKVFNNSASCVILSLKEEVKFGTPVKYMGE